MKFSYYPGCTLKNKAKDLEQYALYSAKKLGIELQEIDQWQCCGGVYPMGKDEIAPKLSSVRALADARNKKQDLVTLCSACHNVLKQVNNDMATDEDQSVTVNTYMGGNSAYELTTPYTGETTVLHFLEILRDTVGFDALAKQVTNPLIGEKIGAYYGCLLLRPSNVLQMDNAENPTIIEDFIKAIGADPVVYGQRNECCGAYTTLENKAIPIKRSAIILENALDMGAKMLVTACPLCLYNLNKNGNHPELPVVYFTTLLAASLGSIEAQEALENNNSGVNISVTDAPCSKGVQ
ncbi:MAG TPA: CoB--CoM heterodisulfide reductase iron-sulfur subunit B family protein [Treponemataceae bacterium]|nr:CoB--CoM heterodisulfide reductase iron-sulfur subunit B family protein [Treponemataceae bacterium]